MSARPAGAARADDHRHAAGRDLRQPGEPRGDAGKFRIDSDRCGRSGEQGGGGRLYRGRIGDAPAGRRHVERKAEGDVSGGSDRGDAAGQRGDAAREIIGAMVTTDQRYGHRAFLRDRDDRSVAVLVVERRRHRTHQDARSAQADDRATRRVKPANFRDRIVEMPVGAGDAAAQAVQRRAEGRREPSAELAARGRQGNDRGRHGASRAAAAPRRTMMSEK